MNEKLSEIVDKSPILGELYIGITKIREIATGNSKFSPEKTANFGEFYIAVMGFLGQK